MMEKVVGEIKKEVEQIFQNKTISNVVIYFISLDDFHSEPPFSNGMNLIIGLQTGEKSEEKKTIQLMVLKMYKKNETMRNPFPTKLCQKIT